MISKSLLTTTFCLSFISGVYLSPTLKTNIHPYFILICLSLFILFYFLQNYLSYFFIILLGLLIAGTRFQSYQALLTSNNIQILADSKQSIVGTISKPPYLKNNKQYLQISNLSIDNQRYQGKILLDTLPLPKYQYGQQIFIKGLLVKPENFSSDFSYTGYLSKDQVFLLSHQPNIKIVKPADLTLLGQLYSWREYLIHSFQRNLAPANSALIAGILIGEKNLLSSEQNEYYRAAGLSHIVVVSGFNLTIFATIFLKFLRGRFPRTITFLLTLLSIGGFTLLTGAESSVVRAFFMSTLLIMAPFVGRKNNPTICILLAACIMIYLNPLILWYDAGFHLSFLATVGLIYFSEYTILIFKPFILPEQLKQVLSETTSAQITTTPYILTYFHNFSLIAPISNLLVLPLVPLSMLMGTIYLIINSLHSPILTPLIALPLSYLLNYFNQIAYYFNKIPWGHFNNIETTSHLPIIGYTLIAIIYFILSQNAKKQKHQLNI